MADLMRADVAYMPSGPEFALLGLAGLLLIAAVVALAVTVTVLIVRKLRKKRVPEDADGRPVPPDMRGGAS